MPRVGDLTKCKIYKITSLNNPELVYYGHTCQPLSHRFAQHKSPSNDSTSKIVIEKGDAIILLVEEYPCETQDQANAREAFYILNNLCVNKFIPERSNKQYHIDFRDKISERKKQYHIDFRDKISEQKKAYYEAHKEKRKEYDKLRNQKAKLLKSQLLNNESQATIPQIQV